MRTNSTARDRLLRCHGYVLKRIGYRAPSESRVRLTPYITARPEDGLPEHMRACREMGWIPVCIVVERNNG